MSVTVGVRGSSGHSLGPSRSDDVMGSYSSRGPSYIDYNAKPDLTAFQKRGGKLIQYHGWNDAAIPAPSSRSTIAVRIENVQSR